MTRLRIGLCSADHLKSFPRAPAITQINVLRPFDPWDCMDQTRRARSDAPQRGRTLRRRTICADLTAMLEAGGCARQPRDLVAAQLHRQLARLRHALEPAVTPPGSDSGTKSLIYAACSGIWLSVHRLGHGSSIRRGR